MTEQPSFPATVPSWTLGDRLRKARRHAGLEQTELASEIGIARSSIVNYEMDRKSPARPVLLAWSFRCGVSLEWLSDGTEKGPNPGPGAFAQFRGGEVNVPKNLNPWDSWGSPTPLTLAVAA